MLKNQLAKYIFQLSRQNIREIKTHVSACYVQGIFLELTWNDLFSPHKKSMK